MMRAMKTHLRKDSTIGLAGTLTTRFAGTLPQDLQMARIDLIVGPYQRDDQYCVSQIHARRSAVLDEETREAAGDAVFGNGWPSRRQRQRYSGIVPDLGDFYRF